MRRGRFSTHKAAPSRGARLRAGGSAQVQRRAGWRVRGLRPCPVSCSGSTMPRAAGRAARFLAPALRSRPGALRPGRSACRCPRLWHPRVVSTCTGPPAAAGRDPPGRHGTLTSLPARPAVLVKGLGSSELMGFEWPTHTAPHNLILGSLTLISSAEVPLPCHIVGPPQEWSRAGDGVVAEVWKVQVPSRPGRQRECRRRASRGALGGLEDVSHPKRGSPLRPRCRGP